MWMLKRVKVALYERALVYRDRDLERVDGGLEGVLTKLVPSLAAKV